MTVLQRTDLATSQKVQCAAAALTGQHEHGSKTALSQAYEISRPTLYAAGATAEYLHAKTRDERRSDSEGMDELIGQFEKDIIPLLV